MSVNLPSPALLAMLVFAEASRRTRILKAAFFPLLRGLRGPYGGNIGDTIRVLKYRGLNNYLVAEFIRPPKVYTFRFVVGNILPESVKCIHSATKVDRVQG